MKDLIILNSHDMNYLRGDRMSYDAILVPLSA